MLDSVDDFAHVPRSPDRVPFCREYHTGGGFPPRVQATGR
jgi:hypothetical protein